MIEHSYAMGWQRDLPDFRDYTADKVLAKGSSALKAVPKAGLPDKEDLSY